MWSLLTFLLVGFIAGLVARALVPGRSPRGLVKTTLLGLAGSLVGGFLGYVLLDEDLTSGPLQWSGLLGSVLGAVLVLLVYRRRGRRR